MTQRKTIAWALMITFATLWPVAVVFVLHPIVTNRHARPQASTADLQMLLQVRRYEIAIPDDKDNWRLGLVGLVDGTEHYSGVSAVSAGSKMVLLIQRSDAPRLKYCWYGGTYVVHGSMPNPLLDAGVSSERVSKTCKPGDWLVRGGRNSITDDKPADFEVRVALSPPPTEER